MYRCHMEFYLIHCPSEVLETVQTLTPLDSFNHSFLDSSEPRAALLARADVILAVPLAGEGSVRALAEGKKESAQLILLAEKDQIAALGDSLSLADELWTLPLSREELIFRFTRWQEKQKQRMDLWQANQYLDALINSTPSLVWFKDKDGVHEKVNDAFCATVNKTKEQVQGRLHLGRGAGRSRLHRVGAGGDGDPEDLHLGGGHPGRRRAAAAHHLQVPPVRLRRHRDGHHRPGHRCDPGAGL